MLPLTYFSTKLDPIAARFLLCLRRLWWLQETLWVINFSLFPFHMLSLLYFLNERCHTYPQLGCCNLTSSLLEIIVKYCNMLNPASLLPMEGDGESHCCVTIVSEVYKP